MTTKRAEAVQEILKRFSLLPEAVLNVDEHGEPITQLGLVLAAIEWFIENELRELLQLSRSVLPSGSYEYSIAELIQRAAWEAK